VSASLDPASRRRSIFTPTTRRVRDENFEDYWAYTQGHDGLILESEKDLVKKKALLASYTDHPVRSRRPLPDPERFYRNYVTMKDDPSTFDRKTLLLTFLYKFARHEWVGICGAWDGIPTMAQSKQTKDRISRYHLCEEFCHVRLFHEMFRTFQLDRVMDGPGLQDLPLLPGVGHVAPGLRERTDGAHALSPHRPDP
jgi:hypothetical protein